MTTASCCQTPATHNATTHKVDRNVAADAPAPEVKVFVPQVDIIESEDRILLVADLPGVEQDGLEVSLEKNVLTIRGKVTPHVPDGYQLMYSEYAVGNYERAFTVSNDIDRQNIEAVLRDGVLRLTLPKAKHAVAQKISVKTN